MSSVVRTRPVSPQRRAVAASRRVRSKAAQRRQGPPHTFHWRSLRSKRGTRSRGQGSAAPVRGPASGSCRTCNGSFPTVVSRRERLRQQVGTWRGARLRAGIRAPPSWAAADPPERVVCMSGVSPDRPRAICGWASGRARCCAHPVPLCPPPNRTRAARPASLRPPHAWGRRPTTARRPSRAQAACSSCVAARHREAHAMRREETRVAEHRRRRPSPP